MNTKYFLQGALVSLVTYYINPKVDYKILFLVGILSGLLFMALDKRNSKCMMRERFEDFNDRFVRYGDIIVLRNSNKYLNYKDIEFTGSLDNNNKFIIEALPNKGGSNSTYPVKGNDEVYLRTYSSKYLNNDLTLVDTTADETKFKLETTSDNFISYGSKLKIKSGDKYLSRSSDDKLQLQANIFEFEVLDRFGQSSSIDWARQGTVKLSNNNDDGYKAINGVPTDIVEVESTGQTVPKLELDLGRNIYIKEITITNGKELTDLKSGNLTNFNLLIMDRNDNLVAKNILGKDGAKEDYRLDNIYKVGSKVVLELNAANTLFVSNISVYGEEIKDNSLTYSPVSSNLLQRFSFDGEESKLLNRFEIPNIRSSVSFSFWLNIKENNSENNDILHLGSDKISIILKKNNRLNIGVNTGVSNDGLSSSTVEIPKNKLVNMICIIDGGKDRDNGWKVVKNENKRYLVNDVLRIMYSMSQDIFDSNYSTYSVANNVDLRMYKNLGVLNRNTIKPSLKLYMNGELRENIELKGIPKLGRDVLIFGKNRTIRGEIKDVKIYNYVINNSEIQKIISTNITSVCKLLIGDEVNANSKLVVPHTDLPKYSNEYSLNFWFRNNKKYTGEERTIIEKGAGNSLEYSLNLLAGTPFMKLKQKLPNGTIDEGRIDYEIPSFKWIHITYQFSSNGVELYINGQLKYKKNIGNNINFSALRLGGFEGKLYNCKFCNYLLNEKEIKEINGYHPETEINEKLTTLFRNTTGCSGFPGFININPDAMQRQKSLYLADNMDELNKYFNEIQDKSKKYDVNGKQEFKQFNEMCNGYSVGKNSVTKSQECPAPPMCLPTAPFECQREKTINDFDIETHKHFHKYLLKEDAEKLTSSANVTCPPSQTCPPIEDLQRRLELSLSRKEVDPVELIAGIQDPIILKQIADDLGRKGYVKLSQVVEETNNEEEIRSMTENLIKTRRVNLSDLIKSIRPEDIMKVLKGLVNENKIPVSKIIQLARNTTELNKEIKNMLNSGTLTPNELLGAISDTNYLKKLVSDKCKNINLSVKDLATELETVEQLGPNYRNHPLYRLLERKRISELNIRRHPELRKYIKKDNIPCWGCTFDSVQNEDN